MIHTFRYCVFDVNEYYLWNGSFEYFEATNVPFAQREPLAFIKLGQRFLWVLNSFSGVSVHLHSNFFCGFLRRKSIPNLPAISVFACFLRINSMSCRCIEVIRTSLAALFSLQTQLLPNREFVFMFTPVLTAAGLACIWRGLRGHPGIPSKFRAARAIMVIAPVAVTWSLWSIAFLAQLCATVHAVLLLRARQDCWRTCSCKIDRHDWSCGGLVLQDSHTSSRCAISSNPASPCFAHPTQRDLLRDACSSQLRTYTHGDVAWSRRLLTSTNVCQYSLSLFIVYN